MRRKTNTKQDRSVKQVQWDTEIYVHFKVSRQFIFSLAKTEFLQFHIMKKTSVCVCVASHSGLDDHEAW